MGGRAAARTAEAVAPEAAIAALDGLGGAASVLAVVAGAMDEGVCP